MATQIVQVPTSADHKGRTAPSPSAVADAMARLEREFPLVRPVVQYELAAEQAAKLAGLAKSGKMSDLDADRLAAAEAIKFAARTILVKAGRLDLIGEAS